MSVEERDIRCKRLMDAGVLATLMARFEVMTRQRPTSMRPGKTVKRDFFLLWLLAGLLIWQAAIFSYGTVMCTRGEENLRRCALSWATGLMAFVNTSLGAVLGLLAGSVARGNGHDFGEDEAVIFLLNLHVFTRLHINHFGIAAAQRDHTTAAGFYLEAGLTMTSARGVGFTNGQTLCSGQSSEELSLLRLALPLRMAT